MFVYTAHDTNVEGVEQGSYRGLPVSHSKTPPIAPSRTIHVVRYLDSAISQPYEYPNRQVARANRVSWSAILLSHRYQLTDRKCRRNMQFTHTIYLFDTPSPLILVTRDNSYRPDTKAVAPHVVRFGQEEFGVCPRQRRAGLFSRVYIAAETNTNVL